MDFASSSSSKREHMFEKVVTPSDVGKLNRLVIPKQHAEKYFPLDAAAGEKGLLLNFEESAATGKHWRFRYSFWSSSQSYVITKGWSRFVKDKTLFAGDVVSFLRDSADGRFFIDWRRRPAEPPLSTTQLLNGFSLHPPVHPHQLSTWYYNSVAPAPPLLPPFMAGPDLYNYGYGVISPNYSCLDNQFGAPAGPTRFEKLPAVAKDSKRLRLFGVNMDCHDVVLPSPSSQLRLHANNPSPSAATKFDLVTANFLDKGKSSLSLDFGF